MAATGAKGVSHSALIDRRRFLCVSKPCPAATSSQITMRTRISDTNGGIKLSATASHSEERSEGEDIKSKNKRRARVITDEKARWLRRELRATEINNNGMYHSAIASHLAFSDRLN